MRTIILPALILLCFLVIGFFTGLHHSDARLQGKQIVFKQEVDSLRNDLHKTEMLNRKAKQIYRSLEAKQNEIQEKEALIAAKEEELNKLNEQLKVANNETITRLRSLIAEREAEISHLRQEQQKLRVSVNEAQKILVASQKMIEEKNRKIAVLSGELTSMRNAGVTPDKVAAIKVLRQHTKELSTLKTAKAYEYKGDSYKGAKRRQTCDNFYHKAYLVYKSINASFDMSRVAAKIKSRKLRRELLADE